MSIDPPLSVRSRLRIVAAVVFSYLVALAPLVLFGFEGVWWLGILVIGSAPLLAIACFAAFAFAGGVRKRPFRWAFAAGLAAVALSVRCIVVMLTATWVGLVSVPVAALLRAVIFGFLVNTFVGWGQNRRRPGVQRCPIIPAANVRFEVENGHQVPAKPTGLTLQYTLKGSPMSAPQSLWKFSLVCLLALGSDASAVSPGRSSAPRAAYDIQTRSSKPFSKAGPGRGRPSVHLHS